LQIFLSVARLLIAVLISPSVGMAADLRVFVAGSLREVMPAVAAEYEKASGVHANITIGRSTDLRQQIERGNSADIFVSATMDDMAALVKSGKLRTNEVLARNEFCLMAAPGIKLVSDRLVEIMIDPGIKLGTSTPNTDPAGDYAWELFRNLEKIHPGAYAALDAKAIRLLGPRPIRAESALPFPGIFERRQADVFVSYCSNGVATARALKGVTFERFPELINVAAIYGIGISKTAPPEANAFVGYAVGIKGRRIFARYGLR
jgi:molybdate transport system substrate-binding protein